jgi:hypothetical protein
VARSSSLLRTKWGARWGSPSGDWFECEPAHRNPATVPERLIFCSAELTNYAVSEDDYESLVSLKAWLIDGQ